MFFRRQRPHQPTPQELMESLRRAGFSVEAQPDGGLRVSRGAWAVLLAESEGRFRPAARAGRRMGDEIAALVDGGYQKFFRAPSGARKPALASELRELHNFEEDLKEALGLVSLYNESLGTVSTLYLYDRVENRDQGVPRRAWER